LDLLFKLAKFHDDEGKMDGEEAGTPTLPVHKGEEAKDHSYICRIVEAVVWLDIPRRWLVKPLLRAPKNSYAVQRNTWWTWIVEPFLHASLSGSTGSTGSSVKAACEAVPA